MFVKVPADYTTMTTYIGAVCFFFKDETKPPVILWVMCGGG